MVVVEYLLSINFSFLFLEKEFEIKNEGSQTLSLIFLIDKHIIKFLCTTLCSHNEPPLPSIHFDSFYVLWCFTKITYSLVLKRFSFIDILVQRTLTSYVGSDVSHGETWLFGLTGNTVVFYSGPVD